MDDKERDMEENFVLLGRGEGGPVEVLAFDSETGKTLCIFESRQLAIAFARLNPQIRGQGWTLHEIDADGLLELLDNFEYVALDPDPRPGSGKELISAVGFARSIRLRGGQG